MPTTVPALVAPAPGAPFQRSTVQRRDVGEHDVSIDIAYAGICHSDVHQVREEWGASTFPMVPGHEIAGVVGAVGAGVTRYAVGDRVGVGCFVDSCRECEHCLSGDDQYCLGGTVATYNGTDHAGEATYGGYSTAVVVDENYVLSIPEGIALDQAAPLLCAGITTWSPLRHWAAGPGTRVGVVGMGGLGHMAVKLAVALGAEVTVFSQTLSKEEDGRRFGATGYVTIDDRAAFRALQGTFDLIITTVSADIRVNAFLGLLRLDGTLVFVGAPETPQSFGVFALLGGRRSLAGSAIGSIRETQEMLDFCGAHRIGAEVETISADEVGAAYDRMVASQVRYRFVIDTRTIPAP